MTHVTLTHSLTLFLKAVLILVGIGTATLLLI